MKINPKVTAKRVARAVERSMSSLDNPGFCIECGAEVDGVEPDARKYICECCGSPGVYGAEELLIMIAL
jgi:predicted amidophosphoribosyltransferase